MLRRCACAARAQARGWYAPYKCLPLVDFCFNNYIITHIGCARPVGLRQARPCGLERNEACGFVFPKAVVAKMPLVATAT